MKRLTFIGVVSVVLLSGCISPYVGNATIEENNGDEQVTVYIETSEVPENINTEMDVNYLDRVAFIEVVDAIEGQYKESLYIELASEEVEALRELKDTLEPSNRSWDGFGSFDYKLNMYDADGSLVTCWNVPFAYYVMDGEGQCIDENDELKDWIDGIQDSHNIYTEIYNRTPGENYFTDLATVKKGDADEAVDYYEGLEYIKFDLDEEDIESLRLLADTMCVMEEPQMYLDDNLYYMLTVFTEKGDGYFFYVAYDGTIYVRLKSAFIVTGDGV